MGRGTPVAGPPPSITPAHGDHGVIASPWTRRGLSAIALAMFAASWAAACSPAPVTPATPTAAPPSASPTVVASLTPVPSTVGQPTPTPTPAPPGQTATDWGRIWDGVPATFPRRPGSEPTETAAGPASAVLSVPAGVAEAANWYVTALGSAGYHVAGASGPFEDGSYVVDAIGGRAACHVQVTVAKVGTLIVATIMYGASCPFR